MPEGARLFFDMAMDLLAEGDVDEMEMCLWAARRYYRRDESPGRARSDPSTQVCPVLLLALDLADDAVIHAGLKVDDDLAWAMDLAQGALQPVAHIV